MAIILHTPDETIKYAYLNIYPDQFKTEKEKQNPSWIKNTMDYFANRAYSEYIKNRETFVKNYDLVKGILRREDFFEEPEVKTFTQLLTDDLDLPSYVKHYSIMTTPINELIGELSKRPDGYKVKAFDDDSKSEELEYKTKLLQDYVVSSAREKIYTQFVLQGEELDEETLSTLTYDEVKDELDNYTSIAEKWANHILTCTKAEFNIKQKSEEAFRDLSICAREYYHIYEDNSKLGYNIVTENPKNVWKLTTADKQYTSDPSGRAQGAYAAGTVRVMELSEIIELIPEITKEEIDHLRTSLENFGLINARESNLFNGVKPGIGSITYDTYDPLVLQTRMMIESQMKENNDQLQDFLGLTNSVSTFGYKYVVVKAYWCSKRKIGKVSYIDDLGNLQTQLVDEDYKSKTIPTQVSLEWGWINQWYQGLKIGPDIYHIKPFDLLDYCPIIGLDYELKNTEARSLVDMMKPFQVIYNICMNQMYDLLKKEIGNVGVINLRRVPRTKDGDAQDDIDVWEQEARLRGIMFDDDSPENTKAPVTNTSVAKNVDLTRSNELQTRYNLAVQLKNECWELIGMSKQRLGSVTASESATGTNAAIQQSYAQTEPMFVAHEYVLGQLYQAIIDASLFVESQKPTSTLSYITSQGDSAFVQVNGTDIKLRDLKVFPTNRPEDKELFKDIRELAQPAMQNGASLYDVIELYATDSIRKMKKTFKTLKERRDEMENSAMAQKQQELTQSAEIAQAQIEQAQREKDQQLAHDDYQKEMDRINKKEIAIIQSLGFGKVEGEDQDQDQIYDVLESNKLSFERETARDDHKMKLIELQNKNKQDSDKISLEKEKLDVERENMVNDLQIAKINARAKAKEKKKPAKKK
jgi:hypothetical protein